MMARAKRLAARSVVIALAAAAMCVPSASGAQRGPLRVAIGEVGSSGGPDAARALTRAIAEALEQQPAIDVAPARRAQLVVRGSISRWEQRAVSGGLEVRCEVSLVVTEARGGSIRAMLRGRGGARGGGDAARLSSDALRAAVRGALRPLATQGPALAR
ncbi:MAG: hypothetical protein M5U28_44260 [Sandaracinaceae bacterium]|nr:hypothetical protein [Sandaracinaceae bacterium]